MTTAKKNFIKVFNQKVAEQLASSGFSYIKEGNVFVFCEDPAIIAVLQKQFSEEKYIVENKLRF